MQDLAQLIESYDDQSEELQGLQRFRVQDILLVASLYDSYTLSEGKHLSELLFGTYLNLSFMTPPRINRVGTREQALAELEEQPYDLVITLAAAGAMSAPAFGRAVKALQPDAVVYVVAFNARELQGLAHGPGSPDGLDRFFIWRGDVRLFLSMIKLVEDRRNAETDSGLGGVRTLILVEDNISFYSSYLPILLDEFVRQTEALIGKSINAGQRLLRRRLRPKIMLATSLEEGWELYEKYQATVLAVICDVQFPWRGDPQREAGIELLSRIRERDPDLPLMLQSSRAYYAEEAGRLGASFLDKRSPTLLSDFRTFMFENLGFGDFVFRDAKGEEITRADDIDSMLMVLDDVPVATLRYHASRNHFSNWLMARTEFHLADELRHMRISDFPNIEAMREFLRQRLTAIRSEERHGQVEDFVATRFDTSTEFARIGEGSLGGKGRGLAFLHDLISRTGIEQAIEGLRIYVPHSAVLGTAVFDAFVAQDDLLAFALRENDDQAILDRFQAASLPESIIADLRDFLEQVRYPLAVRSSSLLEDSHHLPAAGVYPTHMLPNADPDPEIRQTQLCLAIKHIFASTFFQNAKAYLAATPNRVEDEKMAVIIQQVVGRRHDSWVYPGLSGAACSYNYYPIRDMKPEEGIATVALGLGRTVAEGGVRCASRRPIPSGCPRCRHPRTSSRTPRRASGPWTSPAPRTCAAPKPTTTWSRSTWPPPSATARSGRSPRSTRRRTTPSTKACHARGPVWSPWHPSSSTSSCLCPKPSGTSWRSASWAWAARSRSSSRSTRWPRPVGRATSPCCRSALWRRRKSAPGSTWTPWTRPTSSSGLRRWAPDATPRSATSSRSSSMPSTAPTRAPSRPRSARSTTS